MKKDYLSIKNYYNILDFYLICSREEGGPKSLLESPWLAGANCYNSSRSIS